MVSPQTSLSFILPPCNQNLLICIEKSFKILSEGSFWRGTKAKTRGNRGHHGLRVKPGLRLDYMLPTTSDMVTFEALERCQILQTVCFPLTNCNIHACIWWLLTFVFKIEIISNISNVQQHQVRSFQGMECITCTYYSQESWDGLRNELNGPVTRGSNVGSALRCPSKKTKLKIIVTLNLAI